MRGKIGICASRLRKKKNQVRSDKDASEGRDKDRIAREISQILLLVAWMDGRTDTDPRTDRPSYRNALMRLKTGF